MSELDAFRALIERIRAGDERAAEELVREYEPMIRRAARVRLADPRLGRVLDSMDVCQSVLASFFVRAAMGQYELNTPDQLLRLLATMARNKTANQAKSHRAAKRDVRREDHGDFVADGLADRNGTPSRLCTARELLEEAEKRLSADERQIMERRQEGAGWDDIAAEQGGTAEGLRKKLSRAVARIAKEIGLDESDDD